MILPFAAMSQWVSSSIRVNGLSFRLASDGSVLDSANSAAIETLSGMGLIQKMGLWWSATDNNQVQRVSAIDPFSFISEQWPGPLSVAGLQASMPMDWNNVYPMTQSMIADHQLHFKDQSYTMPLAIRNWPGSNQAPFAPILLPFVDWGNSDQIYEPENGDFPYIQAAEQLSAVSNDVFGHHDFSNANPLGIECHTDILAFPDTAFDKTAIIRYTLFNRSNQDYSDFVLSVMNQFKIGALYNELLCTDPSSKAIFAYNDFNEATFSNKLVSIGCMALNRPIASTMYIENSNDVAIGRPDSISHFYKLMRGVWKNNKPLSYGGNGVDASQSAQYVYTDSFDLNGRSFAWKDSSASQKIGLLNFYPVNFPKQTALIYDVAVYSVESNNKNIKQNTLKCSTIKAGYLAKKGFSGLQNTLDLDTKMALYPNPIKAGEKLSIKLSKEMTGTISIIGVDGKKYFQADLDEMHQFVILPLDLISGLYVLQFETLNTKHTQKLIINH
jgi:hypothetical protein